MSIPMGDGLAEQPISF